ncbi:hypothetical protein GPECTOR_22g913 [Gonium pectorale]|uniref:Guanine nucleotide-binding protein-like 1 n=1 Tax=Gonium pectorale TaxID=33097 RepID=A0A150GHP6_GONPE|nr:hypothetical protein GPECTOR_22g913 [Gonium pectorale]|eukprot:KXZ49319.1 hypothetical protein GPECTOR_22g913 [Gonium pectorale]
MTGRGGGDGAGTKRGSAPAPAWKKPAGSSMSAKAKKEYLKWKREQKRSQADDSDSGWEPEAEADRPSGGAPAATAAAAGSGGSRQGGGGAGAARGERTQDGDPRPPQQEQQRGGGGRSAPDDSPLHYVPMVELPPGDVPASIRAVCGDLGAMRLPRVREEDVGFTAEGRRMGMPKRPAWRGAVRNAEQLHALEEASFRSWVDRLHASVDDPSRVSFFEPKLDFWRQLWRVLERSDVAVMIVDARNPLLHFSDALAHHVMDEHKMAALLVLNKCDLVPAAAVEAWRSFFQSRYPGLAVVASSAAPGGSSGAAEAILDAVLSCSVTREGRRVQVSEVVGMSRDEVLAHSKARNTHCKRDRAPAPAAAAGGAAAAQTAAAAGQQAAAARAEPDEADDDSSEGGQGDDEQWALRGTKAKKKLAVRKKRTQRMHGGGGGGPGQAPPAPAVDEGRGGSSRHGARTQAARAKGAGKQGPRLTGSDAASTGAETDPDAGGADKAAAAVASNTDGDAAAESYEELDAHTQEEEDEVGADTDAGSEDGDNDNAAFEQLADDEDAQGFLSGDEDGADGGASTAGGAGARGSAPAGAAGGAAAAAAAAAAGWGGHGARGGRDARGRSRPVVVCVIGEPNVGKSSTMNALLGAKRVAVSSHPGRTKHYQTHVMCPGLMLCDCPGLVFPRLDVSLHMQVLFGSYPIARCRDPYAVVRYLAERIWPRLHVTLGLKPVREAGNAGTQAESWGDEDWTPLALCEALAARHNWRSRRGGRLDVYRAANWVLRSALAGRSGVDVAFLPPVGQGPEGRGEGAAEQSAAAAQGAGAEQP